MNRNDKNNDGRVLKISSKIPYDDGQIIRKNENIKFPKIFPSKYEDNNLDNLIKQYKKDLKEGNISVANGNVNVSNRAIEQKNQNKIQNQEIALDKSTAEKSRYEALDTKPNFGKSIDESIDKISDLRNSKNSQGNNPNKKEKVDNKNYYHNNEEKNKANFNKNQNKTSFRGDASDFAKFASEKTSENLTINQETRQNNKQNELDNVKNVEQEKSLQEKSTKETLKEIQRIKEEYNALRFAENKKEPKKQKREEKYSKKNGKNREFDFQVSKTVKAVDENKTENLSDKTNYEKDKIIVPEIQIKTEIVSNENNGIKETKTDTSILVKENETKVVNSEKKETQTKNKPDENIKSEKIVASTSKKTEEKKKEKPKVVKQEENKLDKKQKEKDESLKTSKKPTLKVEKFENNENKKIESKKSNDKQIEFDSSRNLSTSKLANLKNKLNKIFKINFKDKNKMFNMLLIASCFVFVINIVLVSMLFYNIKTGGKKYLDINYNTINVKGNGISPSAVQSAWQSSVCVGAGGNVIDNDSFYSKTSNRGSGVVLKINESDNSAYILTCEHVIDGYENAIYVLFSTYLKPIKVTLVGVSMRYDIAVLKVKNVSNIDGIKDISAYDSRYLSLGESSFTVGNALSSGLTVSQGIVSAINKQVSINGVINREIQTDIAINPGNSGGGLFNSAGEFIGLVNAKLSTTNSSGTQTIVEGVSYAIPGTFAISLANNIIRNGGSATYVDFGLTFDHTEKYVSLKLVNDKYIETFEVRISAIISSSCAKNKLKEMIL